MKSIFRLPFHNVSKSLTRPSLMAMQYIHHRNVSGCRYSTDHEWVLKEEGSADYVVGITDYAQENLGEIVFVELEDIGEEFQQNDVFGQIESVKAASELYMPVAGQVTAVNEALQDDPGLVNSSPEKNGWLIKIKVTNDGELESLMDGTQYSEYIEGLDD